MQSLVNPQSAPRDPNAILNECVEIERAIDSISNNLTQLRSLQTRSIDDPDASLTTSTNREIDTLSSSTMALYRQLAGRIVIIKQRPTSADARNKPRVGMVDRKLKQAMNEYRQLEQSFRKKLGEQMERQYRIVNPDASEEELRAAIEDTENNQVFSQAVNKPPLPLPLTPFFFFSTPVYIYICIFSPPPLSFSLPFSHFLYKKRKTNKQTKKTFSSFNPPAAAANNPNLRSAPSRLVMKLFKRLNPR